MLEHDIAQRPHALRDGRALKLRRRGAARDLLDHRRRHERDLDDGKAATVARLVAFGASDDPL